MGLVHMDTVDGQINTRTGLLRCACGSTDTWRDVTTDGEDYTTAICGRCGNTVTQEQ